MTPLPDLTLRRPPGPPANVDRASPDWREAACRHALSAAERALSDAAGRSPQRDLSILLRGMADLVAAAKGVLDGDGVSAFVADWREAAATLADDLIDCADDLAREWEETSGMEETSRGR